MTYPAPTSSNGIPLSSAFTVTADGEKVDVYQVIVSKKGAEYSRCPSGKETASMGYFDFSGTVNVQITSAVSVNTVVVRPLRHNINPVVSRNTISFTLSEPMNLSVEINGDDRHNLHLFANPMETNQPSPSDTNVRYFGPGVHGDGSTIITLNSGETMYVAGGAIVYGMVRGRNVRNIAVRGRGIISGTKTPQECTPDGSRPELLGFFGVNGLDVDGVILLDPASWTTSFLNVDNLTMDNVKAIGWRGNVDGLDLISVITARVRNIFFRAFDDVLAVKAYLLWPGSSTSYRPSEDIIIENSVAWNDCHCGHVIALMELRSPYISNVQLKDIDILHDYGRASVWFEAGNDKYNIVLDNVTVEDSQGDYTFLINGSTKDVTVSNFKVTAGTINPSAILGSSSSRSVSNVYFNNLTYFGNLLSNAAEGQFKIGSDTSNINFTIEGTTAGGGRTTAPAFCHLYNSFRPGPNGSIAEGLGAASNLFSAAKEVLLKATCSSSSAEFRVGNGSHTEYLYNKGYFWTGIKWQRINFQCKGEVIQNTWCVGTATYIQKLVSNQLRRTQYYVAYVCTWTGTQWKCGCRDQTCAQRYWNLQAFTNK